MAKRLNIVANLRRIMEYAEHSEENRPLLVRTDSLLTSDILRFASAMLIENSRLVVPGISSSIGDGLNILYLYDTGDPAKMSRGKYVYRLVDRLTIKS